MHTHVSIHRSPYVPLSCSNKQFLCTPIDDTLKPIVYVILQLLKQIIGTKRDSYVCCHNSYRTYNANNNDCSKNINFLHMITVIVIVKKLIDAYILLCKLF